ARVRAQSRPARRGCGRDRGDDSVPSRRSCRRADAGSRGRGRVGEGLADRSDGLPCGQRLSGGPWDHEMDADGYLAPVLRLITIPISHYCEKARWALDRGGIAYREEPHIQGLHRYYARRAGGARTAPVLVTPEGAIGDSEHILESADAHGDPSLRLFGEGA